MKFPIIHEAQVVNTSRANEQAIIADLSEELIPVSDGHLSNDTAARIAIA